MTLSIMLTVLVIDTEYSYSLVKINHIQAIEMVDHSDGGILTVTLKGDKSEQIVYSEDDSDNTLNLSMEMKKKDVLRHLDEHPGF